MGGAGWMNLIPQLPDFGGAGLNYGIFRKQRQDYASQVRHLRRREYQDMMFSMRKAGLNPILAAGATPGHSGAYTAAVHAVGSSAGIGTAIASNKSADAAGETAGAAKSQAASAKALREEQINSERQAQAESRARTEVAAATREREEAQAALLREQKINEETVIREQRRQEAAHTARDLGRIDADIRKTEAETPEVYGDIIKNPLGTVVSGAKKVGDMMKNGKIEVAKEAERVAGDISNSAKYWAEQGAKAAKEWWESGKQQEAERRAYEQRSRTRRR